MPDIRGEYPLTRFQDQYPLEVPVQVTAVTLVSGVYCYTWSEQAYDGNTGLAQLGVGRSGDAVNGFVQGDASLPLRTGRSSGRRRKIPPLAHVLPLAQPPILGV
jgi:hypothetical protein